MTKENIPNETDGAAMTLTRFVMENGPLREYAVFKNTFMRMLSDLDGMHEEGVCHNDICPDNIIVEVKSWGGIALHLKSSEYAAVPARGNGILNGNDGHGRYWAPENYIGETSFRSDQYQLAMTMHFAVYGGLPGKDPLPDAYDGSPFARCLVKALRLNPAERFRSMDEWLVCLLENFVHFNAYSDFYLLDNTMNPGGHLYIEGDHRQTYCHFWGAQSCKPDNRVMKAYERMGMRLSDNGDFWCYGRTVEADSHTYVYFPNGRCPRMFRLMTVSMSVREDVGGWDTSTRADIDDAVNTVNRVSCHVRGFLYDSVVFLSYERLMDDIADCEEMIHEAHEKLRDADAMMKQLLEGKVVEEDEKAEGWSSVPVFCINEGNAQHVRSVVHRTSVALAKTRCVVRNDTVCIEGPRECIHEGTEIFDFIKNYSYQCRW